jgi:hypothetical protein
MPQLKAGFVGSGGLGSQRYANALGQSTADMQSNLLGAQTGALQQGYAQALQAAINEGQLQNQAAQIQGNLAGQQQTLGLAGAGAMTKGGAEQQAFEQAKINAPLTQATNVANLMKGYNVPSSTTETFKGPIAGVYGPSALNQVVGLGSAIASGLGETTTQVFNPATQKYETKTTPNALQKYWNMLPSFSNSSASQDQQAAQQVANQVTENSKTTNPAEYAAYDPTKDSSSSLYGLTKGNDGTFVDMKSGYVYDQNGSVLNSLTD